MSRIASNLLGKGIRYPFTVTDTKGVKMNDYIDRINQSLFILFSTRKGSRMMQPTFGSDIEKYRFDPFDNVLLDKLEYTITEDIKEWEPRIILDSIEFKSDPEDKDVHVLYIKISYHLVNTDVSTNFVYPYRRGTKETVYSKDIM